MRPYILPVLLLSAVPLFAGDNEDFRPPTPAELQLKSTPLAPGASAVVLDWAQREDDTMRWASQYLRIKVLTEEGRRYGDVEIPYLAWKYDISDIKARTIQPDGTIVPFNGKIFNKTIIRHGGLKLMAKTFTLPDVHAGTIIEYSYMHRWNQPDFSGVRWPVQRDIPVLHEKAWFRPYQGGEAGAYTIFSLSKGLPAGKKMLRDSCCYEVELENLPPYDKEPLGPPEAALSARVYLLYTHPVRSVDEYWNDIGRAWADDIEDFLRRPSALKDEALKATAGASTQEEKVRKLYARTQQLRNLSFEVEKTETEAKRDRRADNKSSIDVVRNGYGYRYQINRAFVSLARAAGFEAHIISVPDREEDFFSRSMPDAGRIAEEIAEVVIDGKPRYLDPGTPFLPFGLLPWQNANSDGLRVVAKNSGTWIEVPGGQPADSPIVRTADLHFDGDIAKGTVVVRYGGLEAQHRRLQARNDDDAAARKQLEDEAKRWFPDGSVVKLTKVTALRAAEEPLVAEYDVELPTLGSATGSRLLLPLSVFHTTERNLLTSEGRKTSIYFPYSFTAEDHVKLHVPAGFRVEALPAKSSVDLTALAFGFAYSSKDDEIELSRKELVQVNVLDPSYYATVRNFYTKLAAADHDNVILRKAQ